MRKINSWADIVNLNLLPHQMEKIDSFARLAAKPGWLCYEHIIKSGKNKGYCHFKFVRNNEIINLLVSCVIYLYYHRDEDITGLVIDHIDSVRNHNSICNLQAISQVSNNRKKSCSLESRKEEVFNLVQQGLGSVRIGKLLGVSTTAVRVFLRKNGL